MMIRFAAVLGFATLCGADILYQNDLITPSEVFDLKYALDSNVGWEVYNTTKYYCVFRNLWTPEDHPKDYPDLARWSTPAIFSHSKQYSPFIMNREANYGVEIIAESGFTTKFQEQMDQAGDLVYDYDEAESFYINKKNNDKNFRYFPPVVVNQNYRYISGISGISPSPDWFTGFYHMDTIDEYDVKFWESFKLRTYPWDAGTDDGQTYTDIDYEKERPDVVKRFTVSTAPNGIFVSPFGDEIRPVAEWECVLHTCPAEDADCAKPDWPPANGCDILRYPECTNECDPKVDSPCQECKRRSKKDPQRIFYSNCCLAGWEPKKGKRCDGSSGAKEMLGVALTAVLSTAAALALAM